MVTENNENKEEKHCPFCNKKIDISEFADNESLKEFMISGLCQKCQDDFFE